MALQIPPLTFGSFSSRLSLTPRVANTYGITLRNILCFSISRCDSGSATVDRTDPKRSQHFQYNPTIWDYDFVQSLISSSSGDGTCKNKMKKVKRDVRLMLDKEVGRWEQLELIDVLERLGVAYLFENEIIGCLENIYNCKDDFIQDSLHTTALAFRILRQHGFQVSQDVFLVYMDESGTFKKSFSEDDKGMLSLYEASHVIATEEKVLDDAISFTKEHLKYQLIEGKLETNFAARVSHSLEIPLHWRMERSEARWYIDSYGKDKDMNPSLLEFAKVEFNMAQHTLQKDLKNMSRWWKNLGVAAKLPFARDRLVESFLWSMGINYKPEYSRCREWLTRVMTFVLIIDDIFDVYGELDDLELFTDAVDRWDYKAMDKLPYYMKICFFALYNLTNEMAYDILKEHGLDILHYLTKSWANFIKAMLVEAKWCKMGCAPSTVEYLDNGWLSSSGSVFLVHAFFATNQRITSEALQGIDKNHDLLYCSSMLFRLTNDLATSSAELERGDISSSIYCYMHETNSSEGDARNHIRCLVMDTWKKMNTSISSSPFSPDFVNMVLNLARTSHTIYQHGDGLGVEDSRSKDHILTLIVNPLVVELHGDDSILI